MTQVPYARILMSVNGGPFSAGAQVIPAGATLAFKGESTAGWNDGASWEIFGVPPNNDGSDWAGPGVDDWIYDSVKQAWVSTSIMPATFTLAGSGVIWGKWLLRLVVNRGFNPATRIGPQTDAAGNLLPNPVIDISGGWEVLSPASGLSDVSPNEGTQFSIHTYIRALQVTLRKLDAYIASATNGLFTPHALNGSDLTLLDTTNAMVMATNVNGHICHLPPDPIPGQSVLFCFNDTSLNSGDLTIDGGTNNILSPNDYATTYEVTKDDWGVGLVSGPTIWLTFESSFWKIG